MLPLFSISLLAQASPDISSVPADFVKSFMIMLAFVSAMGFVGYMGYRKGSAVSGTKEEPVHVHQPLVVKPHTEYALKEETAEDLAAMRERIDSMSRENLRQHEAARKQLQTSIEAGASRQENILRALHDMEQRMQTSMLSELKSLHERLNPLAEKVAEHAGVIQWIKEKLTATWDHISSVQKSFNEAVQRMNNRVDSVVQMFANLGKK